MSDKRKKRQSVRREKSWIVPDRKLEESVILSNNNYLRSYLPADDLAPTMYQEGLLTEEEYAYYKKLRAIATTGANKSEYLMRCLIKRRDGYLRKFCEILCSITGAEYIAEYLDEQYMKAAKAGVTSLSLPGSKWISQSAQDLTEKEDGRKDKCSKCKSLKQENKRLRKTQRWLEIQLEGLKREKQQLQQASVSSQNFIQNSRKHLEMVEENGRELKSLVPLLQRAAILIECSSVAQKGLSANLSQTAEWFNYAQNNPLSDKQSQQSSQFEYRHSTCIRQMSIQTQSSSRVSTDISSDCEEELRPWLNEQDTTASDELRRLSRHIVAAFPTMASYEAHSVVIDHQEISGPVPVSSTDGGTNVRGRFQMARSFSQSDDGYDHLSDNGVAKELKERANDMGKHTSHVPRTSRGCSSPHLRKKFYIK